MNYSQPVTRDLSASPPACSPGCRRGACPVSWAHGGPATGSCLCTPCVQPGFSMSLQSHRVQDPGRDEVCLSAVRVSLSKVGTCTSVPKGLRGPSAPTAGWEPVLILSLLCLAAPGYSIQLRPSEARPCTWVPAAMGSNMCPQQCRLMCSPVLAPTWVSSMGGNWPHSSLHTMLLWLWTVAGWSLLSRRLSCAGYTLTTRNVVSQDRT